MPRGRVKCSKCGKDSPWVRISMSQLKKAGELAILVQVVEKYGWWDINAKPVCPDCREVLEG